MIRGLILLGFGFRALRASLRFCGFEGWFSSFRVLGRLIVQATAFKVGIAFLTAKTMLLFRVSVRGRLFQELCWGFIRSWIWGLGFGRLLAHGFRMLHSRA